MNFPILSSIIVLPLLGAIFVLLSRQKQDNKSAIYISLFTSIANFLLVLFLWYSFDKSFSGFQFIEEKNWISGFIKFKLGIDGISILFIILTAFITPICIVSCVNSVKKRLNEFLIAILNSIGFIKFWLVNCLILRNRTIFKTNDSRKIFHYFFIMSCKNK